MATIAKSSITLISVSDAYTVSLQPSNITISADADGANPRLDNAFTIISLFCGEKQVPIVSGRIVGSSLWNNANHTQDCELTKSSESLKLTLTKVSIDSLSGWREIEVTSSLGQQLIARFSYTIVREVSLLGWIKEWNKQYTEITGESVATPNAFIGRSGADGLLSGVYIGGNMPNHPIGLYGFQGCSLDAFLEGNIASSEIFHLNENGGMIGGWGISSEGLCRENEKGELQILSTGAIRYTNNDAPDCPFWELNSDGSGSFASGNISWKPNGDAAFNGSLTCKSGTIGGWSIGEHSLYLSSILIDSEAQFIGIRNVTRSVVGEPKAETFRTQIESNGGVFMYYQDSIHYGLEGWNSKEQVFSLGSINKIAGWSFDNDALWLGLRKYNTAQSYVGKGGIITLGSEGLRGICWYIDQDGEIDFVNGLLHFNEEGGTISGWTLNPKRFSSNHITLVSEQSYSGIYLSVTNTKDVGEYLLAGVIKTFGGIVIESSNSANYIEAVDKAGVSTFYISGTPEEPNHIGPWFFDEVAFYYGTPSIEAGTFLKEIGITVSPYGIRSTAWRLEQNGAGAIAAGNIEWNKDGNVYFTDKVKLSWGNLDGTIISNGYIRTDLIDVASISASKVFVGKEDGRYVRIYPDDEEGAYIAIGDERGHQVCTIEGITQVNGISDFFTDTTGSVDTDTTKTVKDELSGSNTGISASPIWLPIKIAHTTSVGPICFEFKSGACHILASSTQAPPTAGIGQQVRPSAAKATVSIVLTTYQDSTKKIILSERTIKTWTVDSSYDQQARSNSQSIYLSGLCVRAASAGYHEVSISYSLAANVSGDYAHFIYGSSTADLSVVDIPSLRYSEDKYLSKYFANGFCLGVSAQNYIIGYNTADEGMVFTFRNENYGMQCDQSGLKTLVGGHFNPLPALLYKAYAAVTNRSYTLSSAETISDAKNMSISSSSVGSVALKLPGTWTKLNLNRNNCFINIMPVGTAGVVATVMSIAKDNVVIHLTKNGTPTDCAFMIEITKI